jgi:hypothetical protein
MIMWGTVTALRPMNTTLRDIHHVRQYQSLWFGIESIKDDLVSNQSKNRQNQWRGNLIGHSSHNDANRMLKN